MFLINFILYFLYYLFLYYFIIMALVKTLRSVLREKTAQNAILLFFELQNGSGSTTDTLLSITQYYLFISDLKLFL